jgi:hypothetical protein
MNGILEWLEWAEEKVKWLKFKHDNLPMSQEKKRSELSMEKHYLENAINITKRAHDIK